MPNFEGTDNSETLTGSGGDDVILGRRGDDLLQGLGGDDLFVYRTGNSLDTSYNAYLNIPAETSDDSDTVEGGSGADTLRVQGDYLSSGEAVDGHEIISVGHVAYRLVAGTGGNAEFQLRQRVDITNWKSGEQRVVDHSEIVTLSSVENIQLFFTHDDPPLYLRGTPEGEKFGFNTTDDQVTIGDLSGTGLVGLIEFDGGSGDDLLLAAAATNSIHALGGAGDDSLTAGAADDHLAGGDGDDILDGGGGHDVLEGGTGDDTYRADGTETIVELAGEGYDTVTTALARYTLGANVEKLVHTGGLNFTGIGNAGDNWLQGGGGNDYLIGLDGADTLDGGGGFANTLQGGRGDDLYLVESPRETLVEFAGEGRDRVETHLTSYTLRQHVEDLFYMGAASFAGFGNAQNNLLRGGGGDDVLAGLGGDNELVGGLGVDTADYSAAAQSVHVDMNEGRAVRNGYGGADLISGIENLIGTGLGDILIGEGSDNRLEGRGGSDYLCGLDGDDLLIGGADAANTLQGGRGDDTYLVAHAGDSLIEFAGEGVDLVETALATHRLRAHVENLTYTGTGAFTGFGNDENNVLRGGGGNDRLVGGGGNDSFIGGGGSDRFEGGTGDDLYLLGAAPATIVELAGEGLDRVETALASYTLPVHVEELRYTGAASFTGIGNDSDNLILGGSRADRLEGRAGDDRLVGFGGWNVLLGGDGNDILESGPEGTLDGGAGNDRLVWGRDVSGGAGADVFAYRQANANGAVIRDFSRAEGDKIDLSDFIRVYGPDPFASGVLSLQTVSQFPPGGGPAINLMFDPDGSAGPQGAYRYLTVLGSGPLAESDFIL